MEREAVAYVVKCDPLDLTVGQRVFVQAPAYGGASPVAGDVVFLWFAGPGEGAGLAGRGRIAAASDDHPMDLFIMVDAAAPAMPMTLDDLRQSRDATDGSPTAGLARKLYRHSLSKVARLEDQEAESLDRHFDEAPAPQTSRYHPLREWLSSQTAREFVASFAEIEKVLGTALPASAERPQWWANTTKAHTNVQREAWRAAGYDAFLLKDQARVRFVKRSSSGSPS